MSELTHNLAGAWADRHQRLVKEIAQAEAYPIFYYPEFVESLYEMKDEAALQYRYWATQS